MLFNDPLDHVRRLLDRRICPLQLEEEGIGDGDGFGYESGVVDGGHHCTECIIDHPLRDFSVAGLTVIVEKLYTFCGIIG